MLQSLSLRNVVVSWPTRPTKANGWGGPTKPFRWTSVMCGEIVLRRQFYSGEWRVLFHNGRLTLEAGHLTLGREGNRNVQNFPGFARGFDLHRPERTLHSQRRKAAT